ncbi:Protein of unknown function (DUF630 and DUF632 [Striga hermonthica]|uniref:Nitrate regulatory gene2 protein-like n=1 Tax=Striga hermonthica TaxID=68872 RepID=A0A9N7R2V9_STRHE|nr:Protein of unknown function (DUF630 and DUF632 [Striga hermonthica]
MGCVASRLQDEEEVVSICRERKRQIKRAVERRYALADAHYKYFQSLYGVSAAINLFVARHSPPPLYITIPSPAPEKNSVVSNPLFLKQNPSEPSKKAIPCDSCSSSRSSASEEHRPLEKNENRNKKNDEEEENEEKEKICGYFYMDMPRSNTMASPQRGFEWDFFNPFENVAMAAPEMINVYNNINKNISEEDLRAVREQEGIPELEDERECVVESKRSDVEKEKENGAKVVEREVSGAKTHRAEERQKEVLNVIDTPVRGRELLEALKDIEDHFMVAYDAGKEVSRMLECNRVHLQSNIEEIKESSTKLIQAIPWRSASSRSASCKSLVSGSRSSSAWTEFSNDLFDDYGGMASGSHSLTLERLYAWEKKLYQEVKEGDEIRRIYERKCNHLWNQDVRGDEELTVDKCRAAVKDLYSRILVAIRSAETISNKIEKLRDEELEPQIRELLQGLTRTWKTILESHEIQNKIIFEVKTFTCPSYRKFCNESHRLATLQLETELLNWRSCFNEYVQAQRRYIEALYRWLSKFVGPEVEYYSRAGRAHSPPRLSGGPHLLGVCHDWLDFVSNLPDRSASLAIRSCAKDVRALWAQQGEEQMQKRKVDGLSKELDRKILAFQKAESSTMFLQLRLTDGSSNGPGDEDRAGSWPNSKDTVDEFRMKVELEKEKHVKCMQETERLTLNGFQSGFCRDTVDEFRMKVELEKEKHVKCMQETERLTLNGFQSGFCRVFESMSEFSRAVLKMYNELIAVENGGKSFTESGQVENGGR